MTSPLDDPVLGPKLLGLEPYRQQLLATGHPEREVARALLYTAHHGLGADDLPDPSCAFGKPTCGDWNCLNPSHQVLARSN